MFKKVGLVTALSTAILFSGVFQNSVDASANNDQSHIQTYKFYYSVNSIWGDFSGDSINGLLNSYLSKYQNNNWNTFNWNTHKQEQKNEQPKQTEVTQPVQKEEQPAKQEEPVKQEKPAQKEEKPVKQPETPTKQPVEQQEQQTQNEAQSQQLSQFEQEVVELTNQERAKQGLSPLKADNELSKVAREKSRDMAANNYFDHNSPTYGSPFDMMKSYGITYRTAGENIAMGQRTPAEVVNAWMNSAGHRANILNGNYTHIGVGYVEQGNHWTQQFIGK